MDPVKALMHRHRELCERAVDPLEIAAGLEAHGLTDRTATRFRHRDVFSLAEEMYARRARDVEPAARTAPAERSGARAGWAVLALLPGILCAATVGGLRFTEGHTRLAVAATGILAVSAGLRAALRRGPLGTSRRATNGTRAWTCWLIAYALFGDGLLSAALSGGPDDPWPPATAPVLALALSCAPAVWCAHLFMARARRGLAASRGLAEFAVTVRPLLLGVVALYLCALGALLALCGTVLDQPPPTPERAPSARCCCSPDCSRRAASATPPPWCSTPSARPRRPRRPRSSPAGCPAAPSSARPSRPSPRRGAPAPSPLWRVAPAHSSSWSTRPAP